MQTVAILLLASAAGRVASLNLCTDEYLLLLGRPEQIVGVSYLSQDPRESNLWKEARRYKGNGGSIEDVLPLSPSLVMTMGAGGRATALLAARLRMHVLDLPYATDLKDVASNILMVGTALGQPARAQAVVRKLETLEAEAPKQRIDAIWISGGGQSLAAGSLGARWLSLAGFSQRSLPGGKASLETLLTNPPGFLIESDYRSAQMSGGQQWLDNPIVRKARSRRIVTDGRPWTCLGPSMIPEIERLQKLAR